MKNKDLNRIVIPIVLLIGVFIGGVVVLRTKGIGAQILDEGKKIFVSVADDPEMDPDDDGLKNWEEKIHKTDSRKPDTDGDGYLDGEEVTSGYDPTIPAPGDALEGTDTNQPRPLPKNLTNYLSQLVTQKISSGEITPSEGSALNINDLNAPLNQDILQEALYQVGQAASQYFVLPEISDGEIVVSQAPATKASLDQYIVQLSAAMSYQRAKANGLPEYEVIKVAVESKNFKYIEALIEDYEETVEKLKAVPAPADFADLHKKQIAIFQLSTSSLESIRSFETDPARALAAIQNYPKIADLLQAWDEEFLAKFSAYQK